jgi:hypothetical protein
MSNKTIYKRIALVAVTALGAGLLSVTPASATNNSAAGGSNVVAVANELNIATSPSISGAAEISATAETGSNNLAKSLGLLANSTGLHGSALTSTATMRADGAIAFYTKTANDTAATFVITGGAKITSTAATATGTNFSNISADRKTFVTGAVTASAQISFVVTPDAGTTSFTVGMYKSATLDTITQAKVNLVADGTTSKGDMIQQYNVTVATTSVSGAYSSTYSYVQGQVSGSLAAPTTNVDASGSLTPANAATSLAYISFILKDAYDVSLSGKGALVISASNGATVALGSTSSVSYAAASPTLLTAVSNYAAGTVTVGRPAASANKAFSTTVSISWNGAVVGTKTISFRGEVAKLAVTVDSQGHAGAATTGGIMGTIIATDDAGNVIYPGANTLSAVSSTLNNKVTAVAIHDDADSASGDNFADYDVTCAGTTGGLSAGSADAVQMQMTNPISGTVIKSNAVKITCGGSVATYAASLDKATYAPGDVATLTITGKDAYGNAANNLTDVVGSAGTLMTIAGGSGLTLIGPAPTAGTAVKFNSGIGTRVYKFTVGTTEGDFAVAVSIPVVNGYSLGGADQAVKYSVKSATSTVSNAEVLKSIVALIASINKQIQALQKLILRR